ncbi:hypothetical protein EBB79_14605 [Parasedimentitalea marina]|uniref:Hedgehog/Intein (Hint) domain-containing protein n=1 Tax=Parasedimentitalea marina TaxID=2483033 RepID=A0A3T0N4N3_9RHOB|nr:Hint domain-containing protein [Parasedimentitalea marina]AZV78978.1 hypothetical protein EBB79_14605 [Parasedimentitalea marina]
MSIFTFTPPDYEFAASSGTNVNFDSYYSTFDYPPNSTSNLTITSNMGDDNPALFEVGETYDLTWGGNGGGTMEDATIIRSDYLGTEQGAIVFEGINSSSGELYQMVWTPNFDLEQWFWDNGGASNPPGFYTSEQDADSYLYPCFAAGTCLRTPGGLMRVDDLQPGHMVTTLDNGPQEILWMGKRTILGVGKSAPVVINPGLLGNERTLVVSQHHRVMLNSIQADLNFGEHEVWVPAKSLTNSGEIYTENRKSVTYYHLLLAQHEVLFADGLAAESLFLGDVSKGLLGLQAKKEIAQIVPAAQKMHSSRLMLTKTEATFLALAMGIRKHIPQPAARAPKIIQRAQVKKRAA